MSDATIRQGEFTFATLHSCVINRAQLDSCCRQLFSEFALTDNVAKHCSRTEAVEEILIDSIEVLNDRIGYAQA